jgi:hypothetical protein
MPIIKIKEKHCKNHRKPFGFLPAETEWAEQMIKKGYKQRRCKRCGYYVMWERNYAKN